MRTSSFLPVPLESTKEKVNKLWRNRQLIKFNLEEIRYIVVLNLKPLKNSVVLSVGAFTSDLVLDVRRQVSYKMIGNIIVSSLDSGWAFICT